MVIEYKDDYKLIPEHGNIKIFYGEIKYAISPYKFIFKTEEVEK